MTTEDLARQAGILQDFDVGVVYFSERHDGINAADLDRFAALVRAQALEDAARVCDAQKFLADGMWELAGDPKDHGGSLEAEACADAIRAMK